MLTYDKEITFDKFVRWLGYGLLVVGIFLLLSYLSRVLLPFAVGWLMAYLLFPIVKFVQYKVRVGSRVLSIIITLVVVASVMSFVLWLIIPPMIDQFAKLGHLVTNYIQRAANIDSIPEAIRQWTENNREGIERFLKSPEFSQGLRDAIPNMFRVLGKTANIIISIVGSLIALLYMFFILKDYEYLTKAWIKIFPKRSRPFWTELASDAERELNNYIRGQGTVALIMGILAAFVAGAILGFLNGYVVAKIGVSPLIATIATNYIFKGVLTQTMYVLIGIVLFVFLIREDHLNMFNVLVPTIPFYAVLCFASMHLPA